MTSTVAKMLSAKIVVRGLPRVVEWGALRAWLESAGLHPSRISHRPGLAVVTLPDLIEAKRACRDLRTFGDYAVTVVMAP